jgi:hypothetical protein
MTEVTQSLEEGLAVEGIASHQVQRQPAYARDLVRVLGFDGKRAEEPTEEKRDAERKPQPDHRGSRPSN